MKRSEFAELLLRPKSCQQTSIALCSPNDHDGRRSIEKETDRLLDPERLHIPVRRHEETVGEDAAENRSVRVVGQTLKDDQHLLDKLSARIAALAATNDLLLESESNAASIREIGA